MGFLDKIRASREEKKITPISLEKQQKLTLKKEEVHKISLSKTPLDGLKARVVYAIDFSGSMRTNFNSGVVQESLEAMFPLAMEFDDDGQMEVWLFDDSYRRLPAVNMNNIDGYIEREVLSNKWHMGGTKYAPIMSDITRVCVEANVRDVKMPTFVIFITDGSNDDKAATKKIIKDASYNPIFWKFVGIGGGDFPFLEKLDDLTDRNVDNADYFPVIKPSDITYQQLLEEFPEWLENEKVKAMLR